MVKRDLLQDLRDGNKLSIREMIQLTITLSIPSVIAEISYILMEFIDASMVGSLGAEASASVGLVATTTWLIGGILRSITLGFTVQVAHLYGAKNYRDARSVTRHGVVILLMIGIILSIFAFLISPYLPIWLGGGESISLMATQYFMIYAFTLPFTALSFCAGGMLQCGGNMKTPGILNVLTCILDVIFNYFLINDYHEIFLFGNYLYIKGAGLGVEGAAIGTLLASMITSFLMVYFLFVKSKNLSYRQELLKKIDKEEIFTAIKISFPIAFENLLAGGAQIVSTKIVAPLGNMSIAANSFAITTEGFCYMPGYGLSAASTTVVGQSMGAGRKNTARKIGWICMITGMTVIGIVAILMYALSYNVIGLLTPVRDIRILGSKVLRIEMFAEPFFAASIVGAGVFRGFQDTLVPSIINFSTMWLIRLPLAYFLSKMIGLSGVWYAMCIQLTICGILFILRMIFKYRKEQFKKAYLNN